MSKAVSVLAGLALAALPAPAQAAPRSAEPGEITWFASQRRSADADALCQQGRANVKAKYTGTHGLTAMLVSGRKAGYADYEAFVRGPLIFSSGTFTDPGSHHSWISTPQPTSPDAEDGPAVLGVEVLDLEANRFFWFKSWDFPLACGYDYELTIEDVDQR